MDDIANLIIDAKILEINFKKPFRFSSGILSPVYCDNRLLISMPNYRDKIISAMAKQIKAQKIKFSIIAGIATASIPWATMLAFKLNKPLIYVRKDEKSHGKQKKIEGCFKKNEMVLLIEDLISSGGSAINAIKTLRNAGLIVEHCMGIFTYNIGDAEEKFENLGVKLITLTNINEVLGLAVKRKIIKLEQEHKILGAFVSYDKDFDNLDIPRVEP